MSFGTPYRLEDTHVGLLNSYVIRETQVGSRRPKEGC